MKILFITWDLSIGNDANINIAKTIANELISYGNSVYILGKYNYTTKPLLDPDDHIHYSYIQTIERKKNKKERHTDNKKSTFFGEAITKIQLIPSYFRAKNNQIKTIKAYSAQIEKLCKDNKIDVAIAVSYPFETSIALSSSNITSKKVIYQLDPHFNNYRNRSKKKKLKEEIKVLNNVDLLFVTPLMFEANKYNELSPYLYKMHPLNFPNIRPHLRTVSANNIIFNHDFVNCVFTGNLYSDIRNPSYLLRIFSIMENRKIILHFIGGGDTEQLIAFKNILGERLVIHGVMPYENAINAMIDADILVNINNAIANQMASKIFDYISSGKPIINVCKIKNCPSLKYMNKYPSVINIFEKIDSEIKAALAIEIFCSRYTGTCIEFDKIKNLYLDNTLERVTRVIEETITINHPSYDKRNYKPIG